MDRSLESAQRHDFLEFYLVYSKGNFFKANHLNGHTTNLKNAPEGSIFVLNLSDNEPLNLIQLNHYGLELQSVHSFITRSPDLFRFETQVHGQSNQSK